MPRIIAGRCRGMKLETLSGDRTRPTADGRKEAIFSSIQSELLDCTFLDLFSGSGQIGLEAASRGAKRVCCVETDRAACEVIRRNIEKTRLVNVELRNTDAVASIGSESYDVIFADPPYHQGWEEKVVRRVAESGALNNGGILVLESATETEIPVPDGFVKEKEKICRITKFTVLRRQGDARA